MCFLMHQNKVIFSCTNGVLVCFFLECKSNCSDWTEIDMKAWRLFWFTLIYKTVKRHSQIQMPPLLCTTWSFQLKKSVVKYEMMSPTQEQTHEWYCKSLIVLTPNILRSPALRIVGSVSRTYEFVARKSCASPQTSPLKARGPSHAEATEGWGRRGPSAPRAGSEPPQGAAPASEKRPGWRPSAHSCQPRFPRVPRCKTPPWVPRRRTGQD